MKKNMNQNMLILILVAIAVLTLFFLINQNYETIEIDPDESKNRRPLGSGHIDGTYTLDYMERDSITVDGSQDEWAGVGSQNFYNMPDGPGDESEITPSYFKAVQTGTDICVFFQVYDNTDSNGNDRLDFMGSWSGSDYSFDRLGNGDVAEYAVIDNMFIGWSGEFCIPYSNLEIEIGNEECLEPVTLLVFNGGEFYLRWTPVGGGVSGQFCSPQGWSECLVNEQCSSSQVCSGGNCAPFACLPPYVVGEHECVIPEGHCLNNNDCQDDEICLDTDPFLADEVCTPLECESFEVAQNHQCILQVGACYSNADCNSGEECDSNYCRIAIAPPECVIDSDCGSGFDCTSNSCVLKPGACFTNDDCDENRRCVEASAVDHNVCMPFICESFEIVQNHECVLNTGTCYTNLDCGVGETCLDNHCSASAVVECLNDNDCEIYEECSENECVFRPGACLNDQDCPDTYVCAPAHEYDRCIGLLCQSFEIAQNHECILKAGACHTDLDCDLGETCVNNSCIVLGCVVGGSIECCGDSDCGFGETCLDNVCQETFECLENSDCSNGDVCLNNECVELDEPDNTECSGIINLQLLEKNEGLVLESMVSGLNDCDGRIVSIRESSCSGDQVCSFLVEGQRGSCDFEAPLDVGLHTYFACADLDLNGIDEFDQKAYLVEAENVCESTNCVVSEWGECSCNQGESIGVQIGTCIDNCFDELTKQQACECDIEVINKTKTQEQMIVEKIMKDAQDAITKSKLDGNDVTEAEEKLEIAKELYDAEQYEIAEKLAKEAYELATKEETVERPFWDNQFILIICASGIIIAALIIYLAFRRPGPREPTVKTKDKKLISKKIEKKGKQTKKKVKRKKLKKSNRKRS